MVQNPPVGAAWGCWSCGAPGPILSEHCPHCSAAITGMTAFRQTAAQLYNESLVAAEGGCWSEAITRLEQALTLAGADPGALGLLGLLYHRAGRVPEALAAWRQAGEGEPYTQWIEAALSGPDLMNDLAALEAYNAAIAVAADGGWDKALVALESEQVTESHLAPAFVVKGIAAWVLGQTALAEASWRRAAELDPSVPGLQACLVALVDGAPTMVEAPALAPTPAASMPSKPAPMRWVPAVAAVLLALVTGSAVYENNQAALARTEASATAQKAAADRVPLQQAADRAAQGQTKAEGAAKQSAAREASALRVLLAANPGGQADESEHLLAALQEAKRDGVEVPDWVVQLSATARPKAAVDRYFEGYQAFMAKDYAKAITAFEASLKLDTAIYCSDDAVYLAGKAAELARDSARAVAFYERLVKEYPDSLYQDDALFFGAQTAEASGDRAKATAWYKDLLKRFPDSGYDADSTAALQRLNP